MSIRIFSKRSLALLAAGASFLSGTLFAVGADARDLRMGLITPPSHVWTKVANRMAEKLPEATNGSLAIKVFPAGQLGVEQEMFQQMGAGLIDAGLMTAAITSLRAPSISGWFTPYLFKDVSAAIAAAKQPAAQDMMIELQKSGLRGLGYTFAGMRHILMRDAIVTGPESLKDKKIRIVPFPAMKVWWQAVGAVPTPVNLPEVYQSLQSGLLDGVDIDLDALVGSKFQEVGKSLALTNHMPFPAVMVVSESTWASFTPAEQEAFGAVVEEALAWGSAQQIDAEAKNLEALKGSVAIVEVTDGSSAFAAANEAVEASFGGNPIIAAFQKQAREGAAQ